jgi:thioester reductase-like protein
VLDDGLLSHQSPERCAAVAAAKVQGALHLDRCSRGLPHGFFVVYSSLAAALGSPGQVAYGAANGWLDGLMLQRQAAGLPGLALNWGPWAGGGMAARHQGGLKPLQPAEALALLQRWLPRQGRVALARLEPAAAGHPLAPWLQQLAAELPALDSDQALLAVQTALVELLAELGGFAEEDLRADTRLDALGLDSLMAVELATAVQAGLGVSLGLGALAGEPTLASLAAHLLALLENPAAGQPTQAVDLGAEAQLPADLLPQLAAAAGGGPGPGEAILFTGGTGFLGAFLLADQLQRHPELQIYGLVRAEGAGAARARLRQNLEHYGLWQDVWAPRLVGLPGDLALPELGVAADTWEGLLPRLGGILHNGAQLSYVAPYGQLKAANVGGTLEVLRLAARGGLPLEFISSTSVYEAEAYRGQRLDEGSDLAAWQGIHLGYSQTKWVSERLVWQAAQAGLPVRLYRPPLIAGHSRTGAWHEQDFLHRLVRGCLALGQAPQLAMELDLVPVDYVAAAVGALAWTPHPAGGSAPDVLHLQHPEPVLWEDFLAGLIERGAPLRAEPLAPWLEALAQQPSNPLYPLQPFFTHRWGAEQLTYPELNQPPHKARPSCSQTQQRLEPLGVTCPGFAELVDPYARTFLAELLVHG